MNLKVYKKYWEIRMLGFIIGQSDVFVGEKQMRKELEIFFRDQKYIMVRDGVAKIRCFKTPKMPANYLAVIIMTAILKKFNLKGRVYVYGND